MISMFFGGFCGSNLAGILMDRLRKFKMIGICAISAGKNPLYPSPIYGFDATNILFLAIFIFIAFEYVLISGYQMWIMILTGAIFVTFLVMTFPIYFNLVGELIYPIGEAHGTTLFTAGMNVFGLLIIELVKVIDLKARLNNPDSTKNDGLLWTGVFQGVIFLLGLVFLIGRV